MNKKTLIIAEAGINHNGSLETAKRLAWNAKECGADIVKFQTAKLDAFVSEYAPRVANYQSQNMGIKISQKEMLRNLLLSYEDFEKLADYCCEIGIRFLSTPFDIPSIYFLNALQDIWKIPSGEITNYPYLVKIAKTRKDIILSTGMSVLEEVDDALEILKDNGSGQITLLHCTTQYPAPIQSVNLKAMLTLQEYCKCPVGYSDHTLGITIPIAAVAMGATVIEKHFTLDKSMRGPDHKASLSPTEFAMMVKEIRNVEEALGNGEKIVSEYEEQNMAIARKSIVAAKNIKTGELLTEDNLTTKRPGTGISPMMWKQVIGMRATRNFKKDELIEY